MPTMIAWKLNIYLGTENGIRFGFNSAVAIRLFTFIISFCYRKRYKNIFQNTALYLLMFIFIISNICWLWILPQMASRGGVYFHFMELLIVPMVYFLLISLIELGFSHYMHSFLCGDILIWLLLTGMHTCLIRIYCLVKL